jgi:hypothetical protein
MSAQSRTAFDRIDDSSQASKTEVETSIGRLEQDDDPARSPYAPKPRRRMRMNFSAEESDDSSGDIPRFLLGDTRLSESSGESQPLVEAEDGLRRLDNQSEPEAEGVPESSEKPSESGEGARQGGETAAEAVADDSQALPPARPPALNTEQSEASQTDDIQRLEASLRWLKVQNAELARSHAAQPIARPARPANPKPEIPRSLEPETLMPPALVRAQQAKAEGRFVARRAPLLFLVAGIVAASAAYFVAGNPSTAPETGREAKLLAIEPQDAQSAAATSAARAQFELQSAAAEPQAVGLAPASTPPGEVRPSEPADPHPAVSSDGKSSSGPVGTLAVSTASVSKPPGEPTMRTASRSEAPSSSVVTPVRTLGPAELELLMKQGQEFMKIGDVAAARVVFRRAATAGDAAAALAMGTTYDPLVLKRIGAVGVTPDADLARTWYERARDFGSTEAPRRIDMLANR